MSKHSIMKLFLDYNVSLVLLIFRRTSISNFVKRMYESKDFVDGYVPQLELQKPELAILEELRSELPNLRMLDIGVGAGRTRDNLPD